MKKQRFKIVRLGNRNGTYYCKDTLTGSRTSLETKDRSEAELLVVHKTEAASARVALSLHRKESCACGPC
jgi:hypothetical protein